MIVVDASAALQAAATEEASRALARLDPTAPPLLWSEAFSVLHERVWRGATSANLARATRDWLLSGSIERAEPQGLLRAAWEIADELGWAKTYDAEYVALAQRLGCPLVTIDERLKRGAGRLVTVVGPSEL